MSKPRETSFTLWAAVLFTGGCIALFSGVWVRALIPLTLGVALVAAALILLRTDHAEMP